MDGLFELIEGLVPGTIGKVIVFGSLGLAWYFLADFKSKVDSALDKFGDKSEYLDKELEKAVVKIDNLTEKINDHKESLGKASKAVKGDFMELSKEVSEKTLDLTQIVNKTEYNFLSTQKSMAEIVTKIEHILAELDKRYSGIVKLSDKVSSNDTGLATLKKDVDWVKEATQENKDKIEKARFQIALFDEKLKGPET